MTSWLVFSEDGQHLGPVPTEYVARAIKNGAIPAHRWITEPGRAAWRPAAEVPEVRAALESLSHQQHRDHTVVAPAEAFPSFPPAPSTMKDVPSSGDTINSNSERTLIAPAAFADEYATIAEPPRIIPSGPSSDLDATRQRNPALAPTAPAPFPPVGPARMAPPVTSNPGFDATMRSPEAPVGRKVPDEAETLTAPANAAWPRTNPPPKAPVIEHIVNPVVAARQTPLPRPVSGPPPAAMAAASGAAAHRPSRSGSSSASGSARALRESGASSGGSVLAFFLGGLALGAIAVVLALVWAFRGGLLR